MNVVELLYSQVKKHPNKIALVENGKTITYKQLGIVIQQTAGYFKSKSISKGDRVLIAVPMSIDTYRIVLALLYLGVTPVFMEEWAFKNDFYKNSQLLECKAVVVAKKFRLIALFSKAIRSIPVKLSTTKLGQSDLKMSHVKLDETALLSFTSGSSGLPKIADRSHGFLREQFRVLTDVTKCKGSENVCVGLAVVVLFYLAQGNTVVLRTSKLLNEPNTLNELFKKHKVNQIIDSPQKILSYSQHLSIEQTEKITHTFCGGGPVFLQDAEQLVSLFKNSENTIIYGSTEVEPISTVTAKNSIKINKQNKDGLFVGDIDSNLSLKIINLKHVHTHQMNTTDFLKISCKSNEVGEIIVSGKHVLNTYYKSGHVFKEQKIKVENEYWHKTGDSGFVKDGKLFLTGQVSALIHTDKGIISPFLTESKLREVDGIVKGTVLTYQSKITIVVESDLSIDELKTKINLPFNYNDILKVNKIPMDKRHNTKIDYQLLTGILD